MGFKKAVSNSMRKRSKENYNRELKENGDKAYELTRKAMIKGKSGNPKKCYWAIKNKLDKKSKKRKDNSEFLADLIDE